MDAYICGPAKGTKAKPYRCNCCRRTFADLGDLGVSCCWPCIYDNIKCAACRARGVWVSDFRVGHWDARLKTYAPEGGLGHRLDRLSRTNGIMACGERIPRENFGGGQCVIPKCQTCWPESG